VVDEIARYLIQDGVEDGAAAVFAEASQGVADAAKQSLGRLHVARIFLSGLRQHRPQLQYSQPTPTRCPEKLVRVQGGAKKSGRRPF